MSKAQNLTVDGTSYPLESLSDKARETLASIQFVDAQIQQKQNEWAVADTARMAYAAALKRELSK